MFQQYKSNLLVKKKVKKVNIEASFWSLILATNAGLVRKDVSRQK